MPQLKERGYYDNQYDRMVVSTCRYHESMLTKEKMMEKYPNMTEQEVECTGDYIKIFLLFSIKGDLAEKRDETIRKWMDEARKQDDFFEKASPPNQYCIHCNRPMSLDDKFLIEGLGKSKDRVMFLYKCTLCGYKKNVYDNGEEYIVRPRICEKCGKLNVQAKSRSEGNDLIIDICCRDCGFVGEEIFKGKNFSRDLDYERDRERFCLTDEELNKYHQQIAGFERLKALAGNNTSTHVIDTKKGHSDGGDL